MSGSVSLIDGHIDEIPDVDRCVCCGVIIPEGDMVCSLCWDKWKVEECE